MSSNYYGAQGYPTPIVIPDDGDPAAMAILGAALEGLADRTAQWTGSKLIAMGSVPYVSSAGGFATNFNVLGVGGHAVGEEYKTALHMPHGATLTAASVMFLPDNTHVGLPGTNIAVTISRHACLSGVVPVGTPTTLVTASYAPVSLGDYNDGKVKVATATTSHVVDATGYTYHLHVTEESGANALDNFFFAYYLTFS